MLRKRSLVLESLRRFDLSRFVSTSSKPSLFPARLSWEASSQVILTKKLETALKDHRVDDAWDVFKDYKRLYGFPDSSIMNRFVTVLSYSSDPSWLCKADDLTRLALKQNSGLLNFDALTKLLLSLARAQISESACEILRTMLEKGFVLTSDVLRLVVMHLVKTEVGACLASNYLVQVCHRFVDLKRNSNVVKKPDTVLFNLVLGSCVRFGFSLKGQELIELMARADVVADACSVVIMSCVYEMNGMRDELKKLKECVPSQLLCHYRRLYDNLLSLEFKFDDVCSAGRLVLDMCKSNKDLSWVRNLEKPLVLSVGSHYIKSGLRIQILPKILQRDSSLGVDGEATTFVSYADSKLGITSKTVAKLVYGYKRRGDIPELSNILFSVGGSKLCADVVDACVAIGWLEAAHDVLDDMDSAGSPLDLVTYRKVLSGYYKSKMVRNAEVLLRQMTKAGLITDPSDEITVLPECENTELRELLVQEISEGEQTKVPSTLYELNTSLYYFCKAKMQVDAVTTYRKIQKMKNIPPTVQSFWILIDMYSSLGMYREITVTWGDIKRNMASRDLEVTQDLLEKLVVNFLRGGYFERVMEVVSWMKEKGMYCDVAMYKNEYLKIHKNLYRTLKAADAVTEAQAQRVELVKAFRKLVGII